MYYCISEEMIARSISGSHLLVPSGTRALKSNEIIEISESGMLLWKAMSDHPRTAEELADLLVDEYLIEKPAALIDVLEYLNTLMMKGAVTSHE